MADSIFIKIPKLHIHEIPQITPEFCYYLGYLWADGFLKRNEPVNYGIGLTIQKEDGLEIFPVLNKIMKFSVSEGQKLDRKPTIQFYFNSKVIKKFLAEMDYLTKSQSSADKILTFLPENMRHYWFRGYFDGDGSFSAISQSLGDQYKSFRGEMYGSYEQDWNFVEKILNELNIKYKIRKRVRNTGSSSSISFEKRSDVIKWGEYIYQGEQFGLTRKKEKWEFTKSYLPPRGYYKISEKSSPSGSYL